MSARPWEFFIRAFFARASIYFQLSSTLVKWSLCQSIYVYASRSTSSRVLSVWTPCSFFEGGGFWMSLFGRADISSAMSQAVRMSLSVVFLHSRRFIFFFKFDQHSLVSEVIFEQFFIRDFMTVTICTIWPVISVLRPPRSAKSEIQ